MSNAEADLPFLEMVLKAEDRHGVLPIDSLIALAKLRSDRRVAIEDLASSMQKCEAVAKACLEKLVEEGYVEAHGTGKARDYTLSAQEYQRANQKSAYIHQKGFNLIQQEHMVLQFVQKHGSIKRADVVELCRTTPRHAATLLAKLKQENKLAQKGKNKCAIYEPG
jgi:ATP-dependent DNA helicase RecG